MLDQLNRYDHVEKVVREIHVLQFLRKDGRCNGRGDKFTMTGRRLDSRYRIPCGMRIAQKKTGGEPTSRSLPGGAQYLPISWSSFIEW